MTPKEYFETLGQTIVRENASLVQFLRDMKGKNAGSSSVEHSHPNKDSASATRNKR